MARASMVLAAAMLAGCASGPAIPEVANGAKGPPPASLVAIARGESEVFYVDMKEVKRDGSTLRMWIVEDFAAPVVENGRTAHSRQVEFILYCPLRTFRILYAAAYDGPYGKGNAVRATDFSRQTMEAPGVPANEGSNADLAMDLLCDPPPAR